eukprot:scaffold4292_cov114-Amphora_coffeaeformis.AAC.1
MGGGTILYGKRNSSAGYGRDPAPGAQNSVADSFAVRNRGAHVSEFATEVCTSRRKYILRLAILLWDEEYKKLLASAKTMRWSAPSAD